MTPRPRKVSDAEVFAAAARVMSGLGPAEVTLAEIAAEAGVTAGALVQRFGSKRELLLALTEGVSEHAGDWFVRERERHASPIAVLFAYADCMAEMGASPGALAHHLSWLQLDLTDPDFHRSAKAHAQAVREGIRRLLEEAAAAGELRKGVDVAELARAVEVTVSGSLMTWAFYQDGSAVDWLRHDLDVLLRPLTRRTRARRSR